MATALSFKRSTPAPAAAAPAPTSTATTPPATVPVPVTPPVNTPAPAPAPTPAPAPVTAQAALAAAQEPARAAVTTTEPVTATNAGTLAAQNQESRIVTDDYYKGVGGFEGEWNSGDMATPYISIVGKTSKAFDAHPDWLGQWLYDKEYPLGTELRFVFLRATKWHVQDLPFGSTTMPQRFARMSDARAAGFNESNLKEMADLDLLIEVDATIEGVSDLAHIIEGNKGYILARYSVQSTAYGKTASILAKDMGGFLRGNLINGFYDASTFQKTGQKGTYFIPVLKTAGRTSDALRAQIIERMSLKAAA